MDQISLQGHRGARGLLAENTLPSLAKAFEYGMHGIEFDVQLSCDDQVVIYHDLRLSSNITRTKNGHWISQKGPAIRNLTLTELRQYSLGKINKKSAYGLRFYKQRSCEDQIIPSLADLIEHQQVNSLTNTLLNIEIKHSPLHPNLCPHPKHMAYVIVKEIQRLNLSKRCIVQCFNWAILKEVKQIDPTLPISCLTVIDLTEDTISPCNGLPGRWNGGLDVRDYNDDITELVSAFGADYWSPFYQNLTKEKVQDAHSKKLKVMTWTVNHSISMKRLMRWGVDGIISDYPDKLKKVYNQSNSL